MSAAKAASLITLALVIWLIPSASSDNSRIRWYCIKKENKFVLFQISRFYTIRKKNGEISMSIINSVCRTNVLQNFIIAVSRKIYWDFLKFENKSWYKSILSKLKSSSIINVILIRTAVDAKLDDLCNFAAHCIFRAIPEFRTIYLHGFWRNKVGALAIVATVALITLHSINACKILQSIYFCISLTFSSKRADKLIHMIYEYSFTRRQTETHVLSHVVEIYLLFILEDYNCSL